MNQQNFKVNGIADSLKTVIAMLKNAVLPAIFALPLAAEASSPNAAHTQPVEIIASSESRNIDETVDVHQVRIAIDNLIMPFVHSLQDMVNAMAQFGQLPHMVNALSEEVLETAHSELDEISDLLDDLFGCLHQMGIYHSEFENALKGINNKLHTLYEDMSAFVYKKQADDVLLSRLETDDDVLLGKVSSFAEFKKALQG